MSDPERPEHYEAGHDEPTRFGSGEAEDATRVSGAGPAPAREGASRQIGRYIVVSKLGEGGMGVVFEAEQENPRRRVALKVVRGGAFVDDLHVRMFQREAETLARLDHPNIGAIYEAGRTDEGQHFFAMELVNGQTLDQWLAERPAQLDAREIQLRLRLFQTLCRAVQYAHQRGVIHRDLKPSNIIVPSADSSAAEISSEVAPQLKVLDFGLARITDTEGAGASIATDVGSIKGTLAYMSPEQARGVPEEIDIRTDIYALGVVLYELLTGARPLEVEGRSLLEAVRVICDDEPVPIRERWRGSERLDPDLATIVHKALAKDPAGRYPGAGTFAEDIERFLTLQPILARPPSTVYQLRKLVARRKAPFAAVGAGVLMLVAFGIGMSFLYARSETNLRRALAAETRAEENFGFARDAVDRYFTQVSESPELKSAGLENLRHQLLGTARSFYAELVDRRDGTSDLQAELGSAQIRLANISRVIGEHEDAIAAGREGIAIFEELLERDPGNLFYRRQLASLHSNVGLALYDTGAYEKSERAHDRSLAIDREIALHPESHDGDQSRLANTLDNKAQMLERLGRTEEAESTYEECIALREELVQQFPDYAGHQRALVNGYNNLGIFYARLGRPIEAEPLLAKATPIAEALAEREDAPAEDRNLVAVTWGNLAGVHVLLGHLEDARSDYERELARRRILVREHPAVLDYQRGLGFVYANLGELETRAEHPRDALPWFEKAVDAFDYVLTMEPRHSTTRMALSYTLSWRARAHEALGLYGNALDDLSASIEYDDHDQPALREARDRVRELVE